MPEVKPQVTLLGYTPDPIRSLYMAYRVCYSSLTPREIAERIESEQITEIQMMEFINRQLETGHTSPLEQVVFEFGISGVSRAFSHQFVRHRVGVSVDQQSQRYVNYDGKDFPFVVPPSVAKARRAGLFMSLMDDLQTIYEDLVKDGVPAEDARFVLPNATATNLKVSINFAALLHMADIRLCEMAQWEFRKVVALMRAEIRKAVPFLGKELQPKCMANRLGYCDESRKSWEACPIGKVRPHKEELRGHHESGK